MSPTNPTEVLDGAQLVRVSDDGLLMGVWHGSHTVNFYAVRRPQAPHVADTIGLTPATVSSTGDYATGVTTREEAAEAMQNVFDYQEEVRA